MEKVREEDNVYFRTEQRTDKGANVLMVTSFYENIDVVEVEIYNLARLDNPLKEENIYIYSMISINLLDLLNLC